MSAAIHRRLGRTGLRVSRAGLGGLALGTSQGLGAEKAEARRIFDCFVDHGCTFIDTANVYNGGESELFVGEFSTGRRDRLVVATKYSLTTDPDSANAGGNHRKSMVRAIEDSLRRLKTDYIDLLYLHVWDGTTPADEILRAFQDLIAQGKLLYAGLSDTPVWQASRMQTICELRGWNRLAAFAVERSLMERSAERDCLPMARELGFGITAWGVQAGGLLTGATSVADLRARAADPHGNGIANPRIARHLTPAKLDTIAALEEIAAAHGCSVAQVAIAWSLATAPDVIPLIGGRTVAEMQDNLAAFALALDPHEIDRLSAASAIEAGFPHDLMRSPVVRRSIFGDVGDPAA